MKKKILFIHYNVYHQERWGRTFPLAKAAVQCGYEVTLLTTSSHKGLGVKKEIVDGVEIIICKDIIPMTLLKRGFGFLSFLSRIIHTLTKNYDYVYSDCGETLNAGWPSKIIQWKGGIYISEWGDLLGKGGFYDNKPRLFKIFYGWYFLWAELYFRKSANYVVVLSSMMKQHAISRGIDESKIILVPGGAICDVISFGYMPKSILGLSEDIITLGYIGIDNGEIKDLLPLISVLKKERFKGKFKLIVFGHKLSPALLDKYDLRDIIVEKGWINFYEDYSSLQCVDVFVLLKSNNVARSSMGWPNKLGDYMAIGRPVLLNLYGDVATFVSENPSGFIPVELNEENICQKLNDILMSGYDLKKMGEVNRKLAENVISWHARMKNLLSSLYIR